MYRLVLGLVCLLSAVPSFAAPRTIMLPDGLRLVVLDSGAFALRDGTRVVYLPAGPTWFDVWTGTAYAGGRTVTVPAPIGFPPVFSRDADRTDLRGIS